MASGAPARYGQRARRFHPELTLVVHGWQELARQDSAQGNGIERQVSSARTHMAGPAGSSFGSRPSLPGSAARPRLALVPSTVAASPYRSAATSDLSAAAGRWQHACRRIENWWHARNIVPDLAEDIGSARWLRGIGTMVALGASALAFWPDFSPVAATPLEVPEDVVRSELRTQGIAPLAAGSRNGRRLDATDAVIALGAAPERPVLRLTAVYGTADSLEHMLQRAGVGAADAARVGAVLANTVFARDIAPGTRFDITLGARSAPSAPRPLEAIQFRARFDLALDVRRNGGGFSVDTRTMTVNTVPLRVRGVVGNSLYRSARAAGAPPDAVQDYLRTIDEHLPFEEIDPRDEFDLVVSYKRTGNGLGQAGELLYAGILRDGKPRVQLLRWGPGGGFQSAEAIDNPATVEGSAMPGAPVDGRITSGFGSRRHPILGFVRMHAGVDFASRWGSPVRATSDGTVTFAGWHGGHGNYVRIDHGGGIGSGYAHMSRLAAAPGTHVRQGQVIGYVGSTGLSTGPHLHYELYRGGMPVDPFSVRFAARQARVDPAQATAFKARLRQLLAVRPGFAR